MGFFGLGGSKKSDEAPKSVQRSMDSVAVAKKRMLKSKSQRDAEEAAWAAEEAELAAIEAETPAEAPKISTYNPSASPNKPAVKSAMKKNSKFDSE
jgi:hypothetical protein